MKMQTMIPARKVARKWHKSPAFRAAYDALESEFAEAGAKIEARIKAKRGKHKARKAAHGA